MYNVSKWVLDVALAEAGIIDENKREDITGQESLPAWAVRELGPDFSKQAEAIKWIGVYGRNVPGRKLQEVMTLAHYNSYFGNALSRLFWSSYEAAPSDWDAYVFQDTVPDFRVAKRYRMSRMGGLYRRREKGRAEQQARRIEKEIDLRVDHFSRGFDVSWQVLVNDDLGAIRQAPTAMANEARAWLDEFVSDLYDNATVQTTLNGLGANFGGTGRLTVDNLKIGLNALASRVDPTNGKAIIIRRVHLVVPQQLRIDAATILSNALAYGGPQSNVLSQFVASVQVDPYIGVGAGTPWYLVADKAEMPVITLARQTGWPGPIVSMKKPDVEVIFGQAPAAFAAASFDTGDIEYSVSDVVGGQTDPTFAGVTDHLGLYYSSGTTA